MDYNHIHLNISTLVASASKSTSTRGARPTMLPDDITQSTERMVLTLEPNVSWQPVLGLTLIGLSFLSQVVALFVTRVLHRLRHGGYAQVLRMWFFLACALEQLAFFAFHFQYHVMQSDFKDLDTCIVLRFLIACMSTFAIMWLFVLGVFYFVLTVKPHRCFSFHGRVLAYCITFMWTVISCLMYLVLAFFLRREQHGEHIFSCWNNINDTIHLYLTYGNELIVLVCVTFMTILTRARLTCCRRQIDYFSQRPEFKIEYISLKQTVNVLLFVVMFLCVYYVCLLARVVIAGLGSDLSIMVIHSMKGVVIATATCYLDKHVLDLMRCRLERHHSNGFMPGRYPGSERNHEMNTFVFD